MSEAAAGAGEVLSEADRIRHGIPIGWSAVERELPSLIYVLESAQLAVKHRDPDGFAYHWSNFLAGVRSIHPEARLIGRAWRKPGGGFVWDDDEAGGVRDEGGAVP